MTTRLFTVLRAFFSDEKGQGVVEYGLICVLIAISCILAAQGLGGEEKALYIRSANRIAGTLGSISS